MEISVWWEGEREQGIPKLPILGSRLYDSQLGTGGQGGCTILVGGKAVLINLRFVVYTYKCKVKAEGY